MFNRESSLQGVSLTSNLPAADVNSLLLDSKCPVCGNNEFEWGYLSYQTYYVPGPYSLWRTQTRNRQMIKVRRCLRCNNILQFTDAETTRRVNRSVTMVAVVAIAFAVFLGLGAMLTAFAAR